jgi:hypothetical protein
MKRNFRFVLPSINVGVAIFLMLAESRHASATTPMPVETHLRVWINAPVVLVHNFILLVWDKVVVANCSVASIETCYSVTAVLSKIGFLGV